MGMETTEIAPWCRSYIQGHPYAFAAIVITAARDRADPLGIRAEVVAQHFRISLKSATGENNAACVETYRTIICSDGIEALNAALVVDNNGLRRCLIMYRDISGHGFRVFCERFHQGPTAANRRNSSG